MPNFNQLPQSDHTNPADVLPLNQSGRTVGISVATLQSKLQPQIALPQNTLLGRTSTGTGTPEPIALGSGLSLVSGTLSAAQSLQSVTTVPAFPDTYGTMQHGVVVTRGTWPVNGVFGWNVGAAGETFTVQMQVAATDVSGANPCAVAGYGASASTKTGAVGVYGQGNVSANAPGAWGMNALVANYAADDVGGTTGHSAILYGIEVDVNVAPLPGGSPPLGSAFGIDIAGSSRSTPTGGAYAIHIDRYSDQSLSIPWTYGLFTEDGVATYGLWLGAMKRSRNADGTASGLTGAGSQPIYLNTIDGNGVQHQAYITADAGANLILSPGQPGAITAIGYGATALKLLNGNLDLPAGAGNGVGSTSLGLNWTDSTGTGHRSSILVDSVGNILMNTVGGFAINGNLVASQIFVQQQIQAALSSGSTGSSTPAQQANLVPVRTVTSGSSTTVLAADGVVRIRKSAGSPTSVVLEASPVTGVTHTIKDARGDSALNPITVTAASGTIDGANSYVINVNHQAVTLQFGGDEWSIV